MSKPSAIGIDLGTTHSCVGVFVNGKVEIIPNDQGNRTTPSYVAFTETERLIGDAAKNQAILNPANTVFDVKRLFGRRFDDATIQLNKKHWQQEAFNVINENGRPKIQVEYKGESKSFFPEEISAMVLTKLRESAEAYLGMPVKGAVITVPASFDYSQRRATEDAAKIAGLKVLRIINEPVAAAIGFDQKGPGERNVLVFNLGGGMLDVSVLTIENDTYHVRSVTSDTHVGGEYFVTNMVRHFVDEFQREQKKDLSANVRALHRLRAACEQAKRTLSSCAQARIEIDALFEGIDFYTTITREHFENMNLYLFSTTLESVRNTLFNARMDKTHIHDVVLVGGSTRIPMVQKLLRDFFGGKELNKGLNPDEAAAYGAAIQAAALSFEAVLDMLVLDVAPVSLGVRIGGVVTPLIKRDTRIPTKTTHMFTIGAHNRGSPFEVYEGDYAKIEDNTMLGRFDVTGILPADDGLLRIEVRFEIEANGTLGATAIVEATGAKVPFTTYDNGRWSEDDIVRMANEAEQYKCDDKKQRERVSAKDALERYVFSRKRKIDEENSKVKLSWSDRQIILDKCSETLCWLDGNQLAEREEFEDKQRTLAGVCAPIMHQEAGCSTSRETD